MKEGLEKEMRMLVWGLATRYLGKGEIFDSVKHADGYWQYSIKWYGLPPNFGFATMEAAGETREESLQNFIALLEEQLYPEHYGLPASA